MTYKETLLEACPPSDATTESLDPAFRLLPSATAVAPHFDSNAKLKSVTSGKDLCRLSSCSLFTTKKKAIDIASKFPNLRDTMTHVANLAIPKNSGKSCISNKGHIDFWMYDTFDPLSAIQSIEPI